MSSLAPLSIWIGFIIFIMVMLAIDLSVSKSDSPSMKQALSWTVVWMALALGFNALLWIYCQANFNDVIAKQKALEFFTGYLIEKSLSVDNLFVFLLIFSFFQIPNHLQRRILTYGVLGAIIMRALMILAGSWLVLKFHWILYVFGAFLLFTGIKMLVLARQENKSLADNGLLKFLRKHLPISPYYQGGHFFIKQGTKWLVTPLFIALIFVEISDVIFATDSVPAIFAITQDPFIVFSSNIFAIMGLRSLYFLLAKMADRFHLLKYAVAVILLLIGMKMLVEPWVHVSTLWSLAVIALLLLSAVCLSLWIKPKPAK